MEEVKAIFKYNSVLEREHKSNITIDVNYINYQEISKERYEELNKVFVEFLNNTLSSDISEIVVSLREIFKDIEDDELYIKITKKEYVEEVIYKDGKLTECKFMIIGDKSNMISVIDNYIKGTSSIECNQKDIQLVDIDSINPILNQTSSLVKKVFKLRETERNKENIKKYF